MDANRPEEGQGDSGDGPRPAQGSTASRSPPSAASESSNPSSAAEAGNVATSLLGAIMSGLREALGMDGAERMATAQSSAGTTAVQRIPLTSGRSAPPPGESGEEIVSRESDAQQATSTSSATTVLAATETAAPVTPAPTAASAPTPAPTPMPPHFFRLPFTGPDGRQAVLAFQPMMVPNWLNTGEDLLQHLSAHNGSGDVGADAAGSDSTSVASAASGLPPPTQADPASTSTPPTNSTEGTVRYVPAHPTILPPAASPLPFPIIIDTSTRLGWPIVPVSPAIQTGNADAPMASFVSGPPFHIVLQLAGEPLDELKPSPLLAEAYVDSLERADSELRERMARLGMGNIGVYSTADGGDGALGCGICLEAYDDEDKPSWLVGADEQVVAVDCGGHHTLHAGCLRDWLSNLAPTKWTCPFCRQALSPSAEQIKTAAKMQKERSGAASGSSSSNVEGDLDERRLMALVKPSKLSNMSLRDDIRHREREQGWRCDAPACLPLYTDTAADSEGRRATLVELAPCHHRLHQDCLSVAVKVDDWLLEGTEEDGDEDGDGDVDGEDSEGQGNDDDDGEGEGHGDEGEEAPKVGKWISCPTCRKEAWAEIPRNALRSTSVSGEGGVRGGGHKKRIRMCSPESACVKKLRAEEMQVEQQLMGGEPVIMDVD